jgi:hypothetical protein
MKTSFAQWSLILPRFQAQPGRYGVRAIGLRSGPVTTISGIKILPDLMLDAEKISNEDVLRHASFVAWMKHNKSHELENEEDERHRHQDPSPVRTGSDRELVISRLIDAPRDRVFKSWTKTNGSSLPMPTLRHGSRLKSRS